MNLRDTERMEVAKYVISKMWKCEAFEFAQMKKKYCKCKKVFYLLLVEIFGCFSFKNEKLYSWSKSCYIYLSLQKIRTRD